MKVKGDPLPIVPHQVTLKAMDATISEAATVIKRIRSLIVRRLDPLLILS